jgi:hypothetical protein
MMEEMGGAIASKRENDKLLILPPMEGNWFVSPVLSEFRYVPRSYSKTKKDQ